MDRVKDKVAIITGGTGGIGRVTALLLAREGAAIVITGTNEVNGNKVVAEIVKQGGRAVFVKQDVTSERDWSKVMDKTLAQFGKLDILVNNAGIILFKKIEDTSLEEWQRLMNVNVDGVFLGTKHAIRAMKQSGGGSIINVSSIAGLAGTHDDTSAYCASKGAIRLFTKAAALEFSKEGYDYNIRVNAVCPGGIEGTSLMRSYPNAGELLEKMKSHALAGHAEPIDVAYAILYLASDESKHATGTDLVIDGGWTAQ